MGLRESWNNWLEGMKVPERPVCICEKCYQDILIESDKLLVHFGPSGFIISPVKKGNYVDGKEWTLYFDYCPYCGKYLRFY